MTDQLQMSQLFDTSTDNVGLHLKNIYLEKELDENSTTEFFSVVRKEGNRLVKRELKHYNLDVIICVGYRVSSLRATKFRQWATSVLKNYIQNGYAINNHKITEQRLFALENDMQFIKSKIKNNSLEFNQNIFFDGQIYDAYIFVNDLLKLAKSEIVLIDNYIDDTVFTLFSKYPNINFIIYTSTISKQLKLDFEKYSKQYKNISLKTFKSSHDRFLIIDKKEIYHLGASLKDLGKKWFAFSKMSLNSLNLDDILHKLEV
ncbi:virulence RhuM family protein [Aliarcobacter cryaerophilus]|uniref:virulence RhuM family protein n=1 Tax=Aliarcobacter cryaerophilus TaxID=28198 RepID=UPI0021B62505|nr:virulence RhuM family protein [Aliarcobacter cryaerophilus]MCT7528003.1 virulence RhuM family protein [Aliarcobacter cryaerophilus]